jgi:hypothetical protein
MLAYDHGVILIAHFWKLFIVVVWYQLEELHAKIIENIRQDLSFSVKRRYFGRWKDTSKRSNKRCPLKK